jgi:hypothetical protein
VGALRRLKQIEEVRQNPTDSAATEPRLKPYPRWLVVSSVVLYCAVFWAVIVAAGSWGVELVRVAAALGH